MTIQNRKINFIQNFLELENEEAIGLLEKSLNLVMDKSNKDRLAPYSVEEFNNIIDQAELDKKTGNFITTEELKKQISTWS
jgi:hypothetical protein